MMPFTVLRRFSGSDYLPPAYIVSPKKLIPAQFHGGYQFFIASLYITQ